MTVSFKAPLQSAVTNTAYVSKIADDIKTGKFTLANPLEGTSILSVQKSINQIFLNQGTTEDDVNAKVYANENYITNGDSQKTCIEKLDASLDGVNTDLVNHIASTSAHDGANLDYDNSTSGLTASKISPAIDEVEQRVEDIENDYGVANGLATLDGGGKVPAAQLPSSVVTYEGTWDADTNTPTLADGVGDAGMVYIVNVAGTQDLGSGSITYALGDWVIYNGTIWEKSLNSNAVVSVNSKTGVVVIDKTDIGLGNVTNDSQLKRASADFNTFTEKVTPVNDDIVLIEDSEDSFSKKKVKLSNMLGGGAGGGGSFIWELNGDASPIEASINGISLLAFDFESNMEIYALVTVPESYTDGTQIFLNDFKYYTNSTTNNVFFKTETQLLKTSQVMTALPITGHESSNSEVTLTGSANSLRDIGSLDLCDGVGEINSVAVTAGDTLLIRFFRDNVNESISASADCYVLKYSASIKFDS